MQSHVRSGLGSVSIADSSVPMGGERKIIRQCPKFPEPCPNGCEEGSVERCGVEEHRSVCPLEPVACEMKEFGCSVMVPRKELATHMRESELQHLTAMIALNLRLTRQLQQDSLERDRKFEQLQQQVVELEKKQKEELAEAKDHIMKVHSISEHIEQHTAVCKGYKVLTFMNYNETKRKTQADTPLDTESQSETFYSCFPGYAFQLIIRYYSEKYNEIGAFLYLVEGENDDQLMWPVKVQVQLQLLNQAGDHHHLTRTKILEWKKDQRGSERKIEEGLMKYTDLEKSEGDVQYMMDDCLKFGVHINIL